VAAGESTLSPEMADKLVSAFQYQTGAGDVQASADEPPAANDDPLASLSPREREIVEAIAEGHSNKVIARELGIAETTVKIHVQHILRKLGLTSRVQAAVLVSARR
jgi:two-component system nitrate/nitrite response regulator NarL